MKIYLSWVDNKEEFGTLAQLGDGESFQSASFER